MIAGWGQGGVSVRSAGVGSGAVGECAANFGGLAGWRAILAAAARHFGRGRPRPKSARPRWGVAKKIFSPVLPGLGPIQLSRPWAGLLKQAVRQ